MEIQVNNKSQSIPDECTVSQLLCTMNYPKSSAVFVNERQILLREYDNYRLNEKDTVRIIRMLGGG